MKRAALDWLAVCAVCTAVVLALAVAITLAQPAHAMPAPASPIASVPYRATGLPQHVVHVYLRAGRGGDPWPSPHPTRRPVVVGVLEGGGFAAGSGLPGSAPDPAGARVIDRLYAQGWLVVAPGYTVDNATLAGSGRFGTAYQAEDDLLLALSAAEGALMGRVADVDWRRPGVIGRSAGSTVALRFALDAQPRWVVTYQTVATFAAYQPSVVLKHFTDSNGVPVDTIGAADPHDLHAQGSLVGASSSAGFNCPVWCMAGSAQTYFGSLAPRDFVGLFPITNPHPMEHVLALEQAVQGTPFAAASVFLTTPVTPRTEDAIVDWVRAVEGI